MNCPKCGAHTPEGAVECPGCGVLVAKAQMSETGRHRIPPPAAKKPSIVPLLLGAILAVFVVVLLAARSTAPKRTAAPTGSVDGWYADAGGYAGALDAQKTSSAPVLVYFHTSWCGWCTKLEEDVFHTTAFGERYPQMLKVKIDAEVGKDNQRLNSDFGVNGYPAVFILLPDGKRELIPGYSPRDEYFARIDQALGKG